MNDIESQHLADRAAIHDLLVRLALAQDARDWTTIGDCFTADAAYVHPGGELAGAEAIVGRTRVALTPLDASQHLLGTILVTVGESDASAVTYFQAQHVRRGLAGGDLYIIGGTYRDRLVRCADDRWRIEHRSQEYTWRDGNPDVIRRDTVAGEHRTRNHDLADEHAIRTLTASYTDAINRADIDDIAHVYDDEAVFTMMDRPSVVGRAAILETLRSTVARYQLIMQLVHSGVVQTDGDRARARWQVTELQIMNDGQPRFVAGRYEDEHVRRPDGWKFSRRTFTARYLGDIDFTSGARPDVLTAFPLWQIDRSSGHLDTEVIL